MAANLVITIATEASKARKELNETSKDVEGLGKSTSNMGKVIAAGAAAGVAGLVALGVSAFEAAEESAKIGRETERVIRTTGAAAWTSAKQVSELASAISEKTGADDEAVQSGANLLLTFTNVQNAVGEGNDVFNQATELALDMSTALGSDMSGAAIQLGKALNDPVKGITALSKAGVSFTEQQKEQIRALTEAGDLLGAQKIVLAELRKEFGGAAETAGTPFDKLKVAIGNLQEDIGAKLIPAASSVANFFLENLTPAIEGVTKFLSENGEAVKFLASVGLVGLAAAYGPVVAGQLSLLATGVAVYALEAAEAFTLFRISLLATAEAEGVLAAAMQAFTAVGGPVAVALVAIGGAIYGLMSIMDTSSEVADKFYDKLMQDVDLSDLHSVTQGLADLAAEQQKASRAVREASIGDWAVAFADLVIPIHDVTDSINDQSDKAITLGEKYRELQEQVSANTTKLSEYAYNSALAAQGLDTQTEACLKANEANDALNTNFAAINEKLLAIAKQEKIELTSQDAVDRVTALYEKTLATTSGTQGMTEAQEKYNEATATAKDKTDAFKASLDALVGIHLTAAEAETKYSENSLTLLQKLTANRDIAKGQTDAMAASTVEQTKAINENDSAIQANVKSAIDLANAQYQETGNLQQSTATLASHREALINVMVQTGYTREEATKYIDRLGLTPDAINTQVNLDTGQADKGLAGVNQGLDEAGKGAHGDVTLETKQAENALTRLGDIFGGIKSGVSGWLQGRAMGGPVDSGTPYVVGERGPELFVPRSSGFIVPAAQTARMLGTTINVNITNSGLGIDSPKLQRDLVGALQRYAAREGPVRVRTST